MTLQSITQNAGQLGEILDRTGQPIRKASVEAFECVRQEAGELLSCASEQIRKNPVPVVLGAVAFGVAVGYLLVSNRHAPTFQESFVNEPLEHATDSISTALNRLYGNLKFW